MNTPVSDSASLETYSKAFDNFVGDDADIVGLLAYSLYKSSIRQQALVGETTPASRRNPQKAEVDAFKTAAEAKLRDSITAGIEQATPSIQASRVEFELGQVETRIRERIDMRTNFWSAFGVNLLAWLCTLVVAFLVSYFIVRPGLDDLISGAAQNISADNHEDLTGNATGP